MARRKTRGRHHQTGWTAVRRRTSERFHAFLRAVAAFGKAARTALNPRTSTARRANPWPRCTGCHRRVSEFCEEGCQVCAACCPGHDDPWPKTTR